MISFLRSNAVNLGLGVVLAAWLSAAGLTGACPTCVVPELVAGLVGGPRAEAAGAGQPAPTWSLESLGGRQVSSSELVGEVVVLTFFSRSCAPCRTELAYLEDLNDEFAERGVRILAVNVDPSRDQLSEFVRQRALDVTVALGSPEVLEAFGGVSAVPTTFVVDRQGRVASRHDGLTSGAVLGRAIERAL